jgi:hypothetical protein
MQVRFESDSSNLSLALGHLVEVMIQAGAQFHPSLRIVDTGGGLSAWADGDEPCLMSIPKGTLVPVDQITWSEEPPLRLVATPDHLTPLQRSVLEACTDVMATAGTWEYFRATHPRATITDPGAIAIIQSLHPAFVSASSAAAMIKTRTIRLPLDDTGPQSYLMPLLDLVNHHPKAPAYAGDNELLSISTWRSGPEGECFVSYGSTRDVLGIALAYGYLDENITRVTALPGEHSIPSGGTLRLIRTSHPTSTYEHDALTITGAAWDASDPSVQHQTLLAPIERHMRDRGASALQARHQARVLAGRVRASDDLRLRHALAALADLSGCDLVSRAIQLQLHHLS